ncbi:MAG: hypothetical protein P8Y45_20865 [Exilibacterium sp.]
MNEFACQFGEQNHLNGVFTRPGEFTPAKPMVVLVTAGFTPKSGPFRLYTLLARTIAGMGLAALRFDLGGIGNSEQIDVSTPLKVRTRCDINAATAVNNLFSVACVPVLKIHSATLNQTLELKAWH